MLLLQEKQHRTYLLNVIRVIPVVFNYQSLQSVQNGEIGANFRLEVDMGLLGDRRDSWVHDHQDRRFLMRKPVEHARPQYCTRRGGIVAHQENRIACVNVRVARGLAVDAETITNRPRRKGWKRKARKAVVSSC